MLSVARMPFLVMLNGSDVRVKERIEAEKSYVRRLMRELTKARQAATGAAPTATATAGGVANPATEIPAALAKAQAYREKRASGGGGSLVRWRHCKPTSKATQTTIWKMHIRHD